MSSTDTYPSLESRYALDPEQIERFRADGHIYLPGVACGEKIYRRKVKTRGALFFQKPHPPETPPKD